MSGKKMTYKDSGVDYKAIDKFKKVAQIDARETLHNLSRLNFSEVEQSRGESAYLIENRNYFLAHVEEGLGTKNIIADEMYRITGKSYYDNIAQDTVAAIVNDIITTGALPLSVSMHLAVGNSNWFRDEKRFKDLISGWIHACNIAGASWGGGETPVLKGIVAPNRAMLSGSALGIIKSKKRRIRGNIKNKDVILLLESSGIHANGLTLARKIAKKLPNGYATKINAKTTYGEALLEPTIIYVPIIEECLKERVNIHYAVNITGHGWRKLMRAEEAFVYVIEDIPEPQQIFSFMQKHGPIDDKEAYGNFNMGAGFALYVPEKEVDSVVIIASRHGVRAIYAGHIEKRGCEKKVIIKPKQIEYQGSSLNIR